MAQGAACVQCGKNKVAAYIRLKWGPFLVHNDETSIAAFHLAKEQQTVAFYCAECASAILKAAGIGDAMIQVIDHRSNGDGKEKG